MHRINLPRALPFFAVLLATTLAASTADAGKVIVLAVAGDRDGNFEDGLSSIVQDRHDIVTSGQAERAARRSGLRDLDAPSLGKLARKLGADAVVEGAVSHEDEGYMFVVRIRGKNGKTVKKITVDLRKPKLTKKAKKRLGMGVLDGIDTVLGVADEDDGDEAAAVATESPRKSKKDRKGDKAEKSDKPEKKERKKAFRDSDPEEVAAPAAADESNADDASGDDDRERVAAADDTAAEADVEVERTAPRSPARVRPAAIIAVGPSAKSRNLAFTSRAFDQAPYGYRSSLVPGVRVAAEVYPLAFSGDGPFAGVGVAFDYDQTIGMTTRSSDAPDVDLATVQKHWDAGLRYRIAFGEAATAPTATVGLDYGQRVFQIQRAGLPAGAELDMPDVDYKYIAPGVDLRYPLGMKLAVHGGGRALMLTSAGAIQQPDSYGGAKMTGFEASAGMQYGISRSLMVGVDGSLTQIGYEFLGNGAETFDRDSDPATQDVGGASDRYLGIVAAVGYTY